MKRVAILGATGSIGLQAREVIERHPNLELVAASSGSRPLDGVAPLTQVGGDPIALLEQAEPDVVLNAVVGFAGVRATLWTLARCIDLALANKESLVAAGELALAALDRGGGRLLPVDSEHSALFQCLEGRAPETVDSVVVTASGGPFRGRNRSELEDVIQPTSVVHGLVRLRDGSSLAHVGYPDMRVPISYALTYPDRAAVDLPQLDFASGLVLEFEPVDEESFPMLGLARLAGERGGSYPCAFNAANEVAVAAFLDGRLPFLGIPEVVEHTLDAADGSPATDVEALHEADREARRLAEQALVAA